MIEWITAIFEKGAYAFTVELARYALAAGLMTGLLFAGAHWTAVRRIQRHRPTRSDLTRELSHSLLSVVIFACWGVAMMVMNATGLAYIAPGVPRWWQAVLEFGAIVVAHDAYFYWMHRGLHTRVMFRRAHLTHHKSRAPTPWTAYSFAPIEGVFEGMFLPLFLLIAPMHGSVILAFLIHQIARNVGIHAGHELMPPGFTRSPLTGWLTTTTHHDLHHSGSGANFGLYFTWWDRWMRTEHPNYHQAFEAAARPWLSNYAKFEQSAE